MPEEDGKQNDWFLWLISISSVLAISSAFYFLYFQQNYPFVVEVACDISKEACFQRDCTNPDDCPPNQLSDFKRYTLNAADFKMCKDENCAMACETGLIKCEPIKCVEDLEASESCTTTKSSLTNQ